MVKLRFARNGCAPTLCAGLAGLRIVQCGGMCLFASFRRPFDWYINDHSFSCAVASSQEPPSPVHALYWRTKPQYLRQKPQTTQMQLPKYLHAHPHPPLHIFLFPFFLHLPHPTQTHSAQRTTRKRPKRPKEAHQQNTKVGCTVRRLPYSCQLL